MPETLLRTKLHVPLFRPNLVPRPHLVERLNQGLQLGHKLILVSAPAGFGKTTLVVEWIHKSQFAGQNSSFAWLSLDEHDNDLLRFFTYFIAAIQTAQPEVGETVLSLLHVPQPPPIESILIDLINELAGVETGPHILVLDDYYLITNPEHHQALTFL